MYSTIKYFWYKITFTDRKGNFNFWRKRRLIKQLVILLMYEILSMLKTGRTLDELNGIK